MYNVHSEYLVVFFLIRDILNNGTSLAHVNESAMPVKSHKMGAQNKRLEKFI